MPGSASIARNPSRLVSGVSYVALLTAVNDGIQSGAFVRTERTELIVQPEREAVDPQVGGVGRQERLPVNRGLRGRSACRRTERSAGGDFMERAHPLVASRPADSLGSVRATAAAVAKSGIERSAPPPRDPPSLCRSYGGKGERVGMWAEGKPRG